MKKIIKIVLFFLCNFFKKKFVEYHYFPFDTLEVTLCEEAVLYMESVKTLLSNAGICYRFTDGTALGLYREHGFIKHDNDIDLDILNIVDEKIIIKKMRALGFKIGRIVYFKNQIQQLVFYNNKKIIIDFVIWSQNGEEIFNYSERGYKRSQKVKYFKSLTSVVAFNHSYLIPGYIEEWLCFRYGIDWKVPKTYKGDWKEECGDISLLSG